MFTCVVYLYMYCVCLHVLCMFTCVVYLYMCCVCLHVFCMFTLTTESKNALDEKMSKGHEHIIGTNTTDDHTIKTTTTTTDENGKVRKRQFSREHVQTADVKRTRISTEVNTTSYQSPVQTLINVGYGMDNRDFPDTTSTANEDRQKVLLLTKQLEVEKQQKMDMIAMIQQLTTELNMKRIELKEAKLRLQILESFPSECKSNVSLIERFRCVQMYVHSNLSIKTTRGTKNMCSL